nr:unnamed protein product [Callosobruchus chinensis]
MFARVFGSFLVASAFSVAARFDGPEQCSWLPDNTDTSSSKLAVTCRVRTLEETANITALPVEVTSRLRIQCSDVLFFESSLPTQGLHRLHELEELHVTNCKLLNIAPNSFEGLHNVKKLSVNTFNADWSPTKSLELNSYSLQGLKELQTLDLADNNIRAVPDGTFCSLPNLSTLNLTRNRIRNSERIGFNIPECSSKLGPFSQRLAVALRKLRIFEIERLQLLNLQNNNISEISAEALAGLVSLKTLNLDNNKVGAVVVLDLSGNQLTSNHIDAGTFTGLIRLIVLNLSHNALTRIDGKTFKDLFFLQILDLRNNSIGFIEDNAFLPLYNLHTLNLAENRLNTIGVQLFNGLFVLSKLTLNNNLIISIDARAFQNCSALKELDLSSNALAEVPGAIQELSFLKTLDLGENQITSFQNGSFKNLNQLTGLRLIDNNIGNLSRGMLWDLTNLQKGDFERNTQIEAIRLDENFLTDINGVFATLASLLWLNLSENHLVWFDYAFIPSNLKWLDIHGNFIEHLANYYKIQDEIRVKTLELATIASLRSCRCPYRTASVAPNTFVDKENLARVDMYANDLVNLDQNALRIAPVPLNRSLPEVYLGGNPFHCDCTMEWLQLINNMSASRQYPKVMDLENVMCKMTHSRGMTHMPLNQAKTSDFLCTYETHCFALCHCCDFDACDCEMTCPNNCTCYHDQTWNTNVVDCSGQLAADIPHKIPWMRPKCT